MRPRPDRLLAGLSALLVAAAAAWIVWLVTLAPSERSDALALGGFIISLVLALITILASLARVQRPADRQPITALAESLAAAVESQWRKAADERGLMTPTPIPVRWSMTSLPIMGPVTAAVGSPHDPPPFPPLPGYRRITENDLFAGGGRTELYSLYAGLSSGRLLITGRAGAGKSGAANLLVLDALNHRRLVDDRERERIPVPLLISAEGWDPTSTSVHEWLSKRLATAYPLLHHRGGEAEAMSLLTSHDRIGLILDGLDELEESLRPAALLALADAPFRVVVLSRPGEMIAAARTAWLVGAAAVELQHVSGVDAADYLEQATRGPAPSGWTELLTNLRNYDHGLLATGLSTPLTLSIIRDTYRVGDDVSELFDKNRHRTAHELEQQLIARVLQDAYTRRPGKPEPRYDLNQAQQGLTFIAMQMHMSHLRELAWWSIPRWAPTGPRVIATILFFALMFGFAHAIVGVLFSSAFIPTFISGLIFGAALGIAFGIVLGRGRGEPRRFRIAAWRAMIARGSIYRGLAIGAMCGSGVGAAFALVMRTLGWSYAMVYGVIFGLAAGLAAGLFAVFAFGKPAHGSPLSPHETWRNDKAIGLGIGLLIATVAGALIAVSEGINFGTLVGLFEGFVFFVAFGLTFGLTCSITWPTQLAWFQLILSRRVPAVSLMGYLEYARDRGVLRSVGGVYQFRHSILQDRLIDSATFLSMPTLSPRPP